MSLLKHTTLNFNEPERHHFEDNITIFGEAFLCLNSLCKVSACVFFLTFNFINANWELPAVMCKWYFVGWQNEKHHCWNNVASHLECISVLFTDFFSVCQKEPMHINRGVNSKKNIFSLEEKSIDNSNLLAYEQVLIISPTTGAFLKNEKVDESSESLKLPITIPKGNQTTKRATSDRHWHFNLAQQLCLLRGS